MFVVVVDNFQNNQQQGNGEERPKNATNKESSQGIVLDNPNNDTGDDGDYCGYQY